MPARHLLALWATLHEPRAVTATYMALYTVAVFTGAGIAINPAGAILGSAPHWVVVVIVLMLVIGGGVGVPAAWRGDRWLERPMVILTGAAILIMLMNVTMGAPYVWPLTTLLAATVCAALIPRWMTVTSLTYAPGKGPLSPSDEARIEQYEG